MSSITPGPWKVVRDEVLGFIIPHPADRRSLIARVTKREDAVAIAAVPEMVEMLQETLQELSSVRNLWQLFHRLPHLIDKIAALLARVKGVDRK